ncbi:PAS domain S-box protein [Candidatus Latescibacterota bacterium]
MTEKKLTRQLEDAQTTIEKLRNEVIKMDKGINAINLELEQQVEKSNAELRESEERFRATFEQAAVGVAHVSLEGKWLLVNQKLCDILAYSNDELTKLSSQDITHPDDLDIELRYVKQMLLDEITSYSMEKRYIQQDNSIVWVNLNVSLVHNDSGEPKYFIAVIKDITKRKHAESAVEKLSKFPEENPNPVIRINKKLSVLYSNTAGVSLLKYLKSIDGQPLPKKIAKTCTNVFMKNVKRRIEVKNKSRIIALVFIPVKNTEYLNIYGNDITNEKKAKNKIDLMNKTLEQRIEKRTAQLMNANKDLETFAYSVSHDLRTPLRALSGFSQILIDEYYEKLDDEAKRFLSIIINNTHKMSQLIDDILEFSRIGRKKLNIVSLNMANLFS